MSQDDVEASPPTSAAPSTTSEYSLLMNADEIGRLPRHQDLWFEDGSIVIAGSDISFRLHRGVLARHSGVFKDTFQIPQGEQSLTVDGCPAVQLHDPGEHLILLFTILYDGAKEYVHLPPLVAKAFTHTPSASPLFRRTDAVEFKTLRILLRLAFKYDIAHIQAELLTRLGARFAHDFDAWDDESGEGRLIQMRRADAIAVVNLARAYALPQLLPAALFECAQLPAGELLAPVVYSRNAGPGGAPDAEQLSADDVRLVLTARDALARRAAWVRRLLLDDADYEGPACATGPECRAARYELVRELAGDADSVFHAHNPLVRVVEQVADVMDTEEIHLCEACVEAMKDSQSYERRAVWKELGNILNVENWLGQFTVRLSCSLASCTSCSHSIAVLGPI